MRNPQCVKCGGEMEPGYVIDRQQGQFVQPEDWIEGAPERSVWTGLKTRGKERHRLVTYRCERCGYLESYAPA